MSVLDKVAAALTPPETDEERHNARQQARTLATQGEWLSMVLDHHEQIESCFETVRVASPEDRPTAQKKLALILTGHSIAEESVIYPAMIENHEKAGAGMAYTEQAAAKTQMAMLEKLDPASKDYDEKLEHIRGAVLHHMYEEEGTWFARLKETALQADQQMITQRYREEFERYTNGGIMRGQDAASDAMTASHYGVEQSMSDTQTNSPTRTQF